MSEKNLALGAGLMLLVLVAYVPATRCGFIWDDDYYVTNNETLRTTGGLKAIWGEPGKTPQYYPLAFTSFWAEFRGWGLKPAGYHVVNILLHGGNAVLLWLVLRRLGIPGAWFAAALFALHPVQVESVAWVTERKNVLSGLFYWAALLAYLRFSPPETDLAFRVRPWGWYGLALAFFACALLSKTVTCSLPAALVLLYWWKRGTVVYREVLALAPLFVLGAALAAVTVLMERHHVGAVGEDWALSPVERVLVAGRALWFYAGKLAWPVDLTFIYPRWQIDAEAPGPYAFPFAAAGVIAVLAAARPRLGRGPLVAVLLFAGTLVPALGFVNVYPMRYSFVADHFQYLASVALIVLATAGAALTLERLGPAWVGPVGGGLVVLVLGTLTWRQQAAYENLETLWKDTLSKNPDCWMAHYNLGGLLLNHDDLEGALEHLSAAVSTNPRLAQAHNNLGLVFWKMNRLEEARAHLQTAVDLNPPDPAVLNVYSNLATVLDQLGKRPEAMACFRRALEIDPGYAEGRYRLGGLLAEEGHWDEAVQQLNQAIEKDPTLAAAYNELGEVYVRQGKVAEAIPYYRRAVSLLPGMAQYHQNLAVALVYAGQRPEAEIEFQQARRLAPRERLREVRPP
jgi:protein O-mannosyl-transferase